MVGGEGAGPFQTGGCNPIPVVSKVVGDQLQVDAASIYAQRVIAKGKR